MRSGYCTVKSITALHWLLNGPNHYAEAGMEPSEVSVIRLVETGWEGPSRECRMARGRRRTEEGVRGGGAREEVSEGIVKSFQGRDCEAQLLRGVDMATVSLLQAGPPSGFGASRVQAFQQQLYR